MRSMDPTRARVSGQPLDEFTTELASSRATPGGGAAAAVTASLGASLAAMVVRLSEGREKYQQHAPLHAEALAASDAARATFLDLADQDALAYATYRAARALPHGTEQEVEAREAATRAAARDASDVPMRLVQACHTQVALVERLAGRSNAYLASDLEVAALLLESAARSAAANVTVNLHAIGDEGYASAVRAELDQRIQQIQVATERTRELIAAGDQRRPEST
jgi:formiminotetrahydrofolate cyclodeaminase